VTADQLPALLPLLLLAGGATLMMLQIAFRRSLRLTSGVALLTLVAAGLATIPAAQHTPQLVTPLLMADRLSLTMTVLFCSAAAFTVVLSRDYLQRRGDEPEEYFLLVLLSTLGACVLAYAVHLAALILGLELLSIALYALIAYPDKSVLPLEAAIKYLVLSAAASAIALFGFALLYAATGALGFADLGRALGTAPAGGGLLLVGAVMIFAGLAFKLSVVPFHLWTPDVYQGAPVPVTGFLASVSKAAVFFVLWRLFVEADLFRYRILVECVGLMAIFSMLAGNLLALLQVNMKRMLAFSSIAHMGYLLIVYMAALRSGDQGLSAEAAIYYLIAYTATTVAAFGALTLTLTDQSERENLELQDISGLLWRQPLVALLLLVALLSLAGIPLTAGFIAKFYIIGTAVSGHNWVLLASLVIGSGIGIYYYLRVVLYMVRSPEDGEHLLAGEGSWRAGAISAVLIAAILLLGTVPQGLMAYLRSIL
jgi:NADH-quinone oxidoreductase subunit N